MRRSKEQWQILIAEQQSSGLSASAYCTQHEINPSTLVTVRHNLKLMTEVLYD